MTHAYTPAWVSAVLVAAAMTAGCDRQTVPLPERKTAPNVERRNDAAPAEGTRSPASPGERVPAVPPDTPSGKSIDGGAASAPATKN